MPAFQIKNKDKNLSIFNLLFWKIMVKFYYDYFLIYTSPKNKNKLYFKKAGMRR
jgi:hypothetical protein